MQGQPVAPETLEGMLRHFRQRAEGQLTLETLRPSLRRKPSDIEKNDPASKMGRVKDWIALAGAMLTSGKISQAEGLLYRTFSVQDLHTDRWLAGIYDNELRPIAHAMKRIESDHGLSDQQSFYTHSAPEDWLELSKAYEDVLDAKFEETLREFGLAADADMWRNDRPRFDREREAARLSIFEALDVEKAVTGSIATYEREAEVCAAVHAYCSASVMLGAAAEGRLLLACLQNPVKCQAAATSLPKGIRPTKSDPLNWTLEHLIKVAEAAGWITNLADDEVVFIVSNWLHKLRNSRNLLHAGRQAKYNPHIDIDEETYNDANAAYLALRTCLDYPEGIIMGEASITPYGL